ncbi:flavo protein [Paraphaeosphaeria sporulosa]|uniref:Flavo protein n=1 Tax=Paraphaeosphaeria sporulosa TaxID=1460663 RepID=A0A177CE17_9PLEO|nr:flavo protein [Paraphaeosphaeria sporulosa]OAG05873.1 flavo protein [Paraphaeosphaeria sporulosa]
MPILVLYCTGHGSTADVAKHIASHIAEQMPPAECHDMHSFDVSTLNDYTAIVIGSAVHGAHWLPDATTFITANKAALTSKPLFAFSVGAPKALPKPISHRWQKWEDDHIYNNLQKLLDGRVVMHVVLGGKLDKEDVHCCSRWTCGLIKEGDYKDWEEIDKWADSVVIALKGQESPRRDFFTCT